MRHIYRVLAVLLVAGLLLSACAPAATPAPTSAPAQPTKAAAPAEATKAPATKAAPVKLEFWTLLTGDLGNRLDAMVQEFNKSQDRIQIVNVNQGGYETLAQKLTAAVAAGSPPPITMLDYKLVPYYAAAGVFEPIENLASKEDMADFYPGLLVDLTYKSKVYAVPFNRSAQGLYYNKDMFKAAGLDPEKPPTTWQEFQADSIKLSDASKGQYGAYATGNMQWMIEPYIYQNGGTVSDVQGNFTFGNDPKAIEAAKFLQDLANKYHAAVVPANASGTFDQKSMEFVTGKVAMQRDSTALLSFIGSSVKFNWGFAPLPAGPAGPAVTSGGGNIAISAKATAEQKAAAWEFVRFLTSAKQSAAWHMATGYMPTRKSVMELPEVQAFQKEHPAFLVAVKELEYTKPTAVGILNAPEWGTVMNTAMDRIIIKNEDPATVFKQAAADMQKTIDAARASGKLITTK